jgi:hypothetical protein
MSQSDLRNHLRNVLKKEVASLKRRRGSALLAEGRQTSSRRQSSHKRHGSAMLAEGRRQSSHKQYGSAMLAEGKRKVNPQLKAITKRAKELYQEGDMKWTDCIKQASMELRKSKRHSTKHGEGFFEDFADGFKKGFTGTLQAGLPLLKLIGVGKKRKVKRHTRKGEGVIADVAGLLELGRRQSSRKHSRKSMKGEGVIADVASLLGLGKRRRHSSKGSALIGLPNRIGSSKTHRFQRRVSHKY